MATRTQAEGAIATDLQSTYSEDNPLFQHAGGGVGNRPSRLLRDLGLLGYTFLMAGLATNSGLGNFRLQSACSPTSD